MKKLALILVPCIIGSLVLTAGGVILGIGIGAAVRNGDGHLEEKTFVLEDNFENFAIDLDTSKLEFKVGEEKKVVVKEAKNINHEVSVGDNSLKIKETDNRKWYEHMFTFNLKQSITVYLTATDFDEINIKTDTGEIVIPENFSFNKMDIKLSTGDLYSKASVSGATTIESSTGDLNLMGMHTNSLKMKASTGHMVLKDVEVAESINLEASTGDMYLENVHAKNIETKTSTGKVKYVNSVFTENLKSVASTGDITFTDSDAATIDVDTDTGDVKGTLLTGKTFQVSTHTGKINVPATSGGLCKISTDTGDIIIQVRG